MKKFLSVLLITVCIFALSACNLIDKFITPERVTEPTTTTPPASNLDVTTPEHDDHCTTPEEDDSSNTPEEDGGDQNKGLLVSVHFQSGGVHEIQETMGLPEGSTFADCFNSFMTYHGLLGYNVVCYYNGVAVEPDATFLLQHADKIDIVEVGVPTGDVNYGYRVGDTCPGMDIPLIEGGTFNVAERAGKITIINFWFSTCPWCIIEMPDINRIATEYADVVEVIAISPNGDDDSVAYAQSKWQSYNIQFGTDIGYYDYYFALGGDGYYPRTIIIDENDVVLYSNTGAVDYALMQSIIDPALND